MRFAENNDQCLCRIVLHRPHDAASNTQIASADASHVIARMTVDPVDANTQFARSFENCFVAGPLAAPFFVVANTLQALLFRDLSGHPNIENVLIARKYRSHRQRDVTLPLSNSLEQFHNVDLTLRQGVIITDPDQVCIDSCCQDFVRVANRLESIEFIREFTNVFPAGRRVNFPDIRLYTSDSLPLEMRDLSKSLL